MKKGRSLFGFWLLLLGGIASVLIAKVCLDHDSTAFIWVAMALMTGLILAASWEIV